MVELGQNFRFGYYAVPPHERIRAIRRAGFDSVMFWWGDEYCDTDGDRYDLIDWAFREGLKVNTVHFPSFHADYLWRAETREAYVDQIISALRDCGKYGIENLVLHTTRGLITPPYNEEGLHALSRAVNTAEKLGVNIALENTRFPAYNRFLYDNIASSRLTLCYDSGHEHCYTKGTDILAMFGSRLSTTHLHDNNSCSDQHHLFGEGNIDFVSVFGRLKKLGVRYFNLESYCNSTSCYYGKLSMDEFLSLAYRRLAEFCMV